MANGKKAGVPDGRDPYRYLPKCEWCDDRVLLVVNHYGFWNREHWEHVSGTGRAARVCQPVRVATPREPDPPVAPVAPLPRWLAFWMIVAYVLGRRRS